MDKPNSEMARQIAQAAYMFREAADGQHAQIRDRGC